MSILICRNKIPIGIDTNVNCFAVNKERKENLAEYVKRVRAEKGLSLTDVQKRSGNQIANSYVSRIENGIADSDGVTTKKLQALAKGLGISEDEIFAVARGKKPEHDPEFLKSRLGLLSLKFDKVPPDKRVNVEALLDLLDREVERLTSK